jgi:beta-glucosidase/6-phospho-beta-glucosidase/beta-galactosidase
MTEKYIKVLGYRLEYDYHTGWQIDPVTLLDILYHLKYHPEQKFILVSEKEYKEYSTIDIKHREMQDTLRIKFDNLVKGQ